MASAGAGPGGSLPPNFLLTPQQQSLLFAALNSNKPQSSSSSPALAENNLNNDRVTSGSTVRDTNNARSSNSVALPPNSFESLPMSSGTVSGINQSPFLDHYDYDDVGESSFDFSLIDDNSQMIGELPQVADASKSDSADSEGHEKRSHPDDDEDEDGADFKRRESGGGKTPRKPGRKPLTSEPSSKRKAQNRAAQRAFRERKEKHVKDLETQVEELTKVSEAANNENSKLKAQVDRMKNELNQYKQRLTLMNSQSKAIPREKSNFGSSAINNLNDINFQFNFPKFGSLPGPPQDRSQQRSVSQPISPPHSTQSPARSKSGDVVNTPNSATTNTNYQTNSRFSEELGKFAGVFTPSMTSSVPNDSRASVDSAHFSNGGGSSCSNSTNSVGGPSSSCGTSPEPTTQSPPGSKPIDTMTTIGEEQTGIQSEPFAQFANIDFGSHTNFDWLAQQNGGAFEPQLLGDYREPQDNILSNPSFDDFFNDALDTDFITPYNVAPSPSFSKISSNGAKPNLIDAIDAQQNDFNDGLHLANDNKNCNEIWEKLQACPKAQSGDIDLDGLCSELTKKAKCSGSGPVIGESDFDSVLTKFMGNSDCSDKLAVTLGFELQPQTKNKTSPNGLDLP